MKLAATIWTIVLLCGADAPRAELVPKGAIGLVELPTVLGREGSVAGTRRAVQLFANPRDSTPIGQLRQKNTKQGDECSLNQLAIESGGAVTDAGIPTLEFAYEAPAAIVMAKSRGACQIQLASGTAWIKDECKSGFMPFETLLFDKMLSFKDGALTPFRAELDAVNPGTSHAAKSFEAPYTGELLAVRKVGNKTLLQIAVHLSDCSPETASLEPHTLWIPLHDEHGAVQVWFHSRGC